MQTLVTGAGRGIGYAICRALAPMGHELLMISHEAANIHPAAQKISKEFDTKTFSLAQDLTALNAAQNVADFVKQNANGLQNLVLNAGIYLEGNLTTGTRDALDKQMAINFYAVFELVQKLLPLMDRSLARRIVIIGSTAGLEAAQPLSQYSVSKWALRGYAINLREELRAEKVAVTYVAPGATYTDMWKTSGPLSPDEAAEEKRLEERLLEPADVAKMIAATLSLSSHACVEEIIVRPLVREKR